MKSSVERITRRSHTPPRSPARAPAALPSRTARTTPAAAGRGGEIAARARAPRETEAPGWRGSPRRLSRRSLLEADPRVDFREEQVRHQVSESEKDGRA